MTNPWDNDPIVGSPSTGPVYGTPRMPSPQTTAQATSDQLGVVRTQQQIDSQPLQNASTATNIQQNKQQMQFAGPKQGAELYKNFTADPAVKAYREVLPQIIAATQAGHNGAGDASVVYGWAKAMDPMGSVREGDTDMAQSTAGPMQRAQFLVSQYHLEQGGTLPQDVRRGLIEEMRNKGRQLDLQYSQVYQQYQNLLKQSGLDPSILGPHEGDKYRAAEEKYVRSVNGANIGPTDPSFLAARGMPQAQPPTAGEFGPQDKPGGYLPAGADKFPDQMMAAFRNGEISPDPYAIIGWAKAHGNYDISLDQAKAAAESMKKGVLPGVTAVAPFVPDISNVRGSGGLGEGVDAAVRGAADTVSMGLADKAAAVLDGVSNGGTFQQNLARQYAISDYDQQHHFLPRLGGQIAGGALLPMGEVSGIGNLALKGAGYGAAYGAGSSRSLADVPQNALLGGAAGAAVPLTIGGVAKGVTALRGGPKEVPPLVDPQTGELNQQLDALKPAQRMQAINDSGISTVTPGMAGGRSARVIEQGLNSLPGSAGIMEDVNSRASGELRRAMQSQAQKFGTSKTLNEGGAELQRGALERIDRGKAVISKAYNAIPISPDAPASTANAVATLKELTGRFESNPELAGLLRDGKLTAYLKALTPKERDPAQEQLTRDLYSHLTGEKLPDGYTPQPQDMLGAARASLRKSGQFDGEPSADPVGRKAGLSWNDLKAFRSLIGEKIGDMRFGEGHSTSDLRALYGALSEDMRSTAADHGPRALAAFNRANTLNRQNEEVIQGALTRILGKDGHLTPEKAAAAVQAMTKGGKSTGDLRTLAQIKAATVKSGAWDEIASTLIHLGGQPSNSEGRAFQPKTFVEWYSDMSEPARAMLFKPELRKSLDQFVAVNQQLMRIKGLNNTSNTTPTMIGSGVIGASGILAVSHPLALALPIGGGIANNLMARLWTSPKFVNLMTGYSKAAMSGNQNAVRSQIGRLQKLATTNPELREGVEMLLRKIANDNLAQPVAAGSHGNDQQDGQSQ